MCEPEVESVPVIDPVTPQVYFGKGPYWDQETKGLYYVDVFQGTVHCYRPESDIVHTASIGCANNKPLAIMVPLDGEKDGWIVSLKNSLASVKWDGIKSKTSEPRTFQTLEPNENKNRINNGKIDSKGRVWAAVTGPKIQQSCGSSNKEPKYEEGCGALYMLKDCMGFTKIMGCLTAPSGIEWSSDNKKFFFTDTAKKTLEVYDYCHDAGKICNPKVLFDVKQNKLCGSLDGMVMSESGKLYVANTMGCSILVIDSNTGQLVSKIKIPAKEVTSCCFGGPDNDILFVTTANSEPDPKYPCAGRVFKVTNINDKGLPARKAVI